MKLKSGGSEGSTSYDVFEVGVYAAVKYQPGINLKMLLWLFWLDEKKTEVLRIIFKENSIMPVNGDLRLSNGGIIPVNTIIKVNKKYISPAATKKTSSNPLDVPATKSKDTLVQKPTTSANVWDKMYARLEQVLSTKRKQYLAIAGGVLLVSSLGIGTAVAVSQIIDPPKKAKKVEVAEVDEVSDETTEETDIDTEVTSPASAWEKKVALQTSEDTSESTTTTWEVPTEVPTSQNSPDTPKTESKVPQGGMAKDGTFVFTSKTKAADLREILIQFNAAEQSKKKK